MDIIENILHMHSVFCKLMLIVHLTLQLAGYFATHLQLVGIRCHGNNQKSRMAATLEF